MSDGNQSLITFRPSDDMRVSAAALKRNHTPSMPAISMVIAALATAVATSACRFGAGATADGSVSVMPILLVVGFDIE